MSSCCGNSTERPKPLRFNWMDYLRALFSWIINYRRTFVVEPGLYYTGKTYDPNTPMIVSCNYHLTAFLVWRKLRRIPTRVLVIDTKGINVWCSAGKGQFNATEILKQLARYPREMLSTSPRLTLILPKLSLSGVKLSELRQYGIDPMIGPVYLEDLPAFLGKRPFSNAVDAHYRFDLRDRLFTLVPSVAQNIIYLGIATLVLGGLHLWLKTGLWWQVFPLGMSVVVLYVLGFPYLPTRSFALKGISLFLITALPLIVLLHYFRVQGVFDWTFYLTFSAGSSLLYGLYYTGNSGVSNYSIVRRETIVYLPLAVLILTVSLGSVIWKGVVS